VILSALRSRTKDPTRQRVLRPLPFIHTRSPPSAKARTEHSLSGGVSMVVHHRSPACRQNWRQPPHKRKRSMRSGAPGSEPHRISLTCRRTSHVAGSDIPARENSIHSAGANCAVRASTNWCLSPSKNVPWVRSRIPDCCRDEHRALCRSCAGDEHAKETCRLPCTPA
jgi:hypothetical protein